MEKKDENKSSYSFGTVVGAGIACSIVGAALGALGYQAWKEVEEEQKMKQYHEESHKKPEKIYNPVGPCSICHENMERTVTLPCGHVHHAECIDALCQHHAKNSKSKEIQCPICRKSF